MTLLNTPAKAEAAAFDQLERVGWAIVRCAKKHREGKVEQAARWEQRIIDRMKVYKLLCQHCEWFKRHRFILDWTATMGVRLRVDDTYGYPIAAWRTYLGA